MIDDGTCLACGRSDRELEEVETTLTKARVLADRFLRECSELRGQLADLRRENEELVAHCNELQDQLDHHTGPYTTEF